MSGNDDKKSSSQKIDNTSPFFLGPQDRPGDFITPARLRGDNFDEWAGSIRTALRARRKFGFLDGSISEPTPPCSQDDWLTIHAMLVSWLMNTIDPEVKSTLSTYDDAKLLWDDLNERFSVVNGPRIQQLKSDIARCEQTKTMSVVVYYGKLKVLWDELNNHEPILSCKCGKCACKLGLAHEQRREGERLHQFLMGLCSDYYGQLRSTLLSQDPLPTLNRAYQQVTQEERMRGITQIKEDMPEVAGFAVRTESRGRGKVGKINKSGLLCSHCNRTGHEIVNCFELLGYPDWWGDRPKSDGRGGTSRSKMSSPMQPAAGRGRGVSRANGATAPHTIGTVVGQMSGTHAPTGVPGFSSDQWKALVAAFGNPHPSNDRLNGEFNVKSWIIDTGASNHVTGDASCLIHVKDGISCPVGLPDGQKVVATKEGAVQLFDKICLKHVLYVPRLNCSLISVSQLNDDMNYFVQFSSNMCAIQDLHSRKLIGTGDRRDGLYYFRRMSTVQKVSVDVVSSSVELWHKRMGHPSEKVVKLLPPTSN